MRRNRFSVAMMGFAALLSGCGGGGGSSGSVATSSTGGSTSTGGSGACSLASRQAWALAQLQEWYLFPDTLSTSANPNNYTTLTDYIDALTATARAQGRDRYFTYVTSIAGEDAFYSSGSQAGFGIRLSYDTTARRVMVTEAFENTTALAAGIDRGTEILAIGETGGALRNVSDILAAEGTAGVTNALGPSTAGTTRVLRIRTNGSSTTRDVTIAKSDYDLLPVSSRYGAQTLNSNGTPIGYINLRTFISPADPALRSAFLNFKQAGITNFIVDLRYNGGGLVSIASLLGNLLGGNRASSDVFAYLTFRASKSSQNSTYAFARQNESVSPVRIAFIGTGGTASASELAINAFVPFLHTQVALVGTNTYGKPVGQIALDNTACDDRLRVMAFATENSARNGAYFSGLASSMEATCKATDDLTLPLGNLGEASVAAAAQFLTGRSCTPIASDGITTQSLSTPKLELLTPEKPTTAQRETPGLF